MSSNATPCRRSSARCEWPGKRSIDWKASQLWRATRLEQNAKGRAEEESTAVEKTALPYITTIIDSEGRVWAVEVNGFCGQILSGHGNSAKKNSSKPELYC